MVNVISFPSSGKKLKNINWLKKKLIQFGHVFENPRNRHYAMTSSRLHLRGKTIWNDGKCTCLVYTRGAQDRPMSILHLTSRREGALLKWRHVRDTVVSLGIIYTFESAYFDCCHTESIVGAVAFSKNASTIDGGISQPQLALIKVLKSTCKLLVLD